MLQRSVLLEEADKGQKAFVAVLASQRSTIKWLDLSYVVVSAPESPPQWLIDPLLLTARIIHKIPITDQPISPWRDLFERGNKDVWERVKYVLTKENISERSVLLTLAILYHTENFARIYGREKAYAFWANPNNSYPNVSLGAFREDRTRMGISSVAFESAVKIVVTSKPTVEPTPPPPRTEVPLAEPEPLIKTEPETEPTPQIEEVPLIEPETPIKPEPEREPTPRIEEVPLIKPETPIKTEPEQRRPPTVRLTHQSAFRAQEWIDFHKRLYEHNNAVIRQMTRFVNDRQKWLYLNDHDAILLPKLVKQKEMLEKAIDITLRNYTDDVPRDIQSQVGIIEAMRHKYLGVRAPVDAVNTAEEYENTVLSKFHKIRV